jgi:ubiquinone/menaquinone biosynthesis C-methylase UbiE
MSEHRYIASDEKTEVELNRLRTLEKIFDPATRRHLEVIGVSKGWKCLEVGAGTGSVAQWLSTRIGPTGRIVATEINTRFLRLLNASNIEIRQHDITKDELEKGRYDLVYCRTLLMQLPEPERALKRMADAVRLGGWLMAEEWDYGSMFSTNITNPSGAIFTTTWRAFIDFVREKRIVDPLFGRRVRGLIEQLGFVDMNQEGLTLMCRGDETLAQFDAATLLMGAKPMITAGLLTQGQHDIVQRLHKDRTFNYLGATMFSAWGRKPQ